MNYKKITLLTVLFSVGALTLAMEPPKRIKPAKACYVEFDDKDLRYSVGDITFYKEYNARGIEQPEGKLISFPIKNCDPLPIKTWRDCRWFFTSAIEGNVPQLGHGLEIIDSSITHVYAVRGKTGNHWSHIYFGYDENNPIWENGTKKVFQGKVLYTLNKNTQYTEYMKSYSPVGAVQSIHLRILDTKDGLYFKSNPNDYRDGIEQINLDDLVCEKTNHPYDRYGKISYSVNSTCYWTKEENKLKGIQYSKK